MNSQVKLIQHILFIFSGFVWLTVDITPIKYFEKGNKIFFNGHV